MERKLTLTEAQIADMKEAFMTFDKDKNGKITLSELRTIMRDVLGSAAPSDDQVKEIIKHIDTDKSGDIDFGEFMGLMSDPKFNDLAKNEHRQAFEMFDKDGNGHISLAELRDAFSKIGHRLDEDELDLIVKEADLDGDRQINYEEFLQMMKC